MDDLTQTPAAAPELQEIASAKRDFINMPVWAGLLRNLDDVILVKGGWKGLKLYDELERDPHVSSVLDKRKRAVTSRTWSIEPKSQAARDVAAADLVRRQFEAIQINRICKNFLDATNKGFSVGEVMWQAKDGEYSVLDVQAKNQRRFTFDEDANLKLLTSAAPYKGEPLPQRKFIVHSVGSKDGSPYGLGLGNKLFWPVLFKRQDITFWLTFADKYGSPTAVGTYPRGSSEDDQNKLLGVLRTIAHDTGIIIPEGMMIDLLEAKRSGATDVYEPLARYMDEQISECVLGETMSTTAQGAGLGSGQANVHNEVRVEAAVDDDYLLNATINGSLVRWIVDLNMPGAGYPTFKRDFAEPEDLEKRAKRDQALRQMGADFTPEYITKTYGEGVIWQQGQPPPSATALPPIDEGADPAFAETLRHTAAGARADQLVLQQAAEKLAGRRRLLQQRVDDLHTLLEETGDLVKFREGLVELLRGEPPAEVTESLSRAGFSAQMLGRTRQR